MLMMSLGTVDHHQIVLVLPFVFLPAWPASHVEFCPLSHVRVVYLPKEVSFLWDVDDEATVEVPFSFVWDVEYDPKFHRSP
jgi:hypothetical protein